MTDDIRAYRAKLSDFQPRLDNPNEHTERGMAMLEETMGEVGYLDSMVAANDNVLVSGHARAEKSFEQFGDEVIVVETDGKTPIVHKRIDIQSDDDIARRATLAANRVGEISVHWNAETLAAWGTADLDGLWTNAERDALLMQDIDVIGIDADTAPPRETNNMQTLNTGQAFIILAWGDLNFIVPRELYQRVLDYCRQHIESEGAAFIELIERGFECL